ncbi:MAG: hypothetical protein HY459_01125 [Parcubacteria group bacterium]|nr:hypothetical protein [Parcubacteria group bacterium]
MPRRLAFILIIALLAATGTRVSLRASALNEWTTIGPEGVTVRQYQIVPSKPNRIYALTDDIAHPLYRTLNGGETWTALSLPGTITSFAVAAGDPDRVYAYHTTEGLLVSFDRGATWTLTGEKFLTSGDYLTELRVHPIDATLLFGTNLNRAKLFRSRDGGATWSGNILPDSGRVFSWELDPRDTETLIVGIGKDAVTPYRNRLMRTTDGGVSWTELILGRWFQSIAVTAGDPRYWYAGMLSFINTTRLYRSVDGGITWAVAPQNQSNVASIAIDPRDPLHIYIERRSNLGPFFAESRDGGTTFTSYQFQPFFDGITGLTFDPLDGRSLYAIKSGLLVRRGEAPDTEETPIIAALQVASTPFDNSGDADTRGADFWNPPEVATLMISFELASNGDLGTLAIEDQDGDELWRRGIVGDVGMHEWEWDGISDEGNIALEGTYHARLQFGEEVKEAEFEIKWHTQ